MKHNPSPIQLKCDPNILRRAADNWPSYTEHDACCAHALMRAIEELHNSKITSNEMKFVGVALKDRAAEILKSEFGIEGAAQ